jgi:hypothetical protein
LFILNEFLPHRSGFALWYSYEQMDKKWLSR